MQSGCGRVLLSCLLSVTLIQCSVEGLRVRLRPPQHIDRVMLGSRHSFQPRSSGEKVGEELTVKLHQLNHVVRLENDVMEPKRKRSFPGNNMPLDRLSISPMETKQGTNKQRKEVELPRRRVSPLPIDRLGMSPLPNSRG
ncbi:osteocrin [Genypterus blacodes]|uniref:osteocrin n=1 Tax=Genypterus blacodes TaxID=154954 RepID=UPI003F77060A